jgi:hypothetical protein
MSVGSHAKGTQERTTREGKKNMFCVAESVLAMLEKSFSQSQYEESYGRNIKAQLRIVNQLN